MTKDSNFAKDFSFGTFLVRTSFKEQILHSELENHEKGEESADDEYHHNVKDTIKSKAR